LFSQFREGKTKFHDFWATWKIFLVTSGKNPSDAHGGVGGYSKLAHQKQLRKLLLLVLLSVSDYKRAYASLYFIITNFHMELKPQVKVSHSMNSRAFVLYAMFD